MHEHVHTASPHALTGLTGASMSTRRSKTAAQTKAAPAVLVAKRGTRSDEEEVKASKHNEFPDILDVHESDDDDEQGPGTAPHVTCAVAVCLHAAS